MSTFILGLVLGFVLCGAMGLVGWIRYTPRVV